MLEIRGQFIAGQELEGEEAPEVAFNPATGEELTSLASASRDQVDAAVAAAKKAYRIWSRMAPKERAERMLRIADRIEQLAGQFAELEMRNCGKPIGTARAVDVGNTIDVFRFFAGAARTVHGLPAGEYRPGYTSMLRRDSLGVPFIEAQNEDDLFFASGYVAAEDRLWQMVMMSMAAKGRMAEIGTHDELLALNGIYANLYRMTYETEKAQREEEMAGEDAAVARRRRAELSAMPAAGGGAGGG